MGGGIPVALRRSRACSCNGRMAHGIRGGGRYSCVQQRSNRLPRGPSSRPPRKGLPRCVASMVPPLSVQAVVSASRDSPRWTLFSTGVPPTWRLAGIRTTTTSDNTLGLKISNYNSLNNNVANWSCSCSSANRIGWPMPFTIRADCANSAPQMCMLNPPMNARFLIFRKKLSIGIA